VCGILVCRSLDPPKLGFVCGNRIIDVEWQFNYHDLLSRTREYGNQMLTFQDFMPFVPIYLGVEGKEWPRILLRSGYIIDIIRISKPIYMTGLLEKASNEIY
jgi:hypothetical protein